MYDLPWFFIALLITATSRLGDSSLCIGNRSKAFVGSEENFKLQSGEKLEIEFKIHNETFKSIFNEISKSSPLVKNNLTLILHLSWLVWIKVEGTSPKHPVLVTLKDRKTEKSFRIPYMRINDRKKRAVTFPFSEKTSNFCPYETITENSALDVFLYWMSNKNVSATVKVDMSVPWLHWKKLDDRAYESRGILGLSSPVVKRSFFSQLETKNDESIIITVESEPGSDCFCNIVSIQQPNCPYFDSVNTAIR